MPFNTESSSTISRADAVKQITELALEQGLKGTFKVFYDGSIIADPSNLPEEVDMDKVSISAVMDQA